MNKRIAIRPVALEDQKAFIAACKASAYLHRRWVNAPCDPKSFKQYVNRFDGKNHHGFIVYLVESGEFVGAINLTNIVLGALRSGYLGYFAFAGFEGKGFIKKGLKAVVHHGFTRLRLHRMEANIQPENTASIALARSCGFSKEGYSPAYLKVAGRWRDHERWAILHRRTNAAQPLAQEPSPNSKAPGPRYSAGHHL